MFLIYALSTLCLVYLTFTWVLYPRFVSPLSKIPNAHFSAPFSSAWVTWKRIQGQDWECIRDAFARQGAIVRLGPNELALNTIDNAVSTVYGGTFEKTGFYDQWKNYGIENAFSAKPRQVHAARRQQLMPVFAKSYIQNSSNLIAVFQNLHYEGIIPHITSASQQDFSLDVLPIYTAYGIDFVTAYTFGLPRCTNFLQDVEARDQFLEDYLHALPSSYMSVLQGHPKVQSWLAYLGLKVIPDGFHSSRARLEAWVLQIVDKTESLLSDSGAFDQDPRSSRKGDFPVVYSQLRSGLRAKSNKEELEDTIAGSQFRMSIASEFFDHIMGIRDVFGVTFACILHDISRHEGVQRELQEELRQFRSAFHPEAEKRTALPLPKDLESLPLLGAVILESLRLRTTSPDPRPRSTPMGKTTNLAGYLGIPGGVHVTAYAWFLHHNEAVFPNANEWHHERWLGSREDTALQRKWFWAFGSGGRGCIGDHMAYEMIRYAIAGIYTWYTTRVDSQKGMGEGQWIMGKDGDHLKLHFTMLEPGDD